MIRAILDHNSIDREKVTDQYIEQNQLEITLNVNGYYNDQQIANNLLLQPGSIADNQLVYTLTNLDLKYTNPIRNNQWSYFKFKFSFRINDSGSQVFQVMEFPLYKNEASIPRPGLPVQLTKDKFFFRDGEIVLHFNSNTSDFEYQNIRITRFDDGFPVATFKSSDSRNIKRGNNLQAVFKIETAIKNQDRLKIEVESHTGVKYPFDDKITEETNFRALTFNIVDGTALTPFSNAQTFDKQKLIIQIQTNAVTSNFDLSGVSNLKLELVRDPIELYHASSTTRYDLSIDATTGIIRQELNLESLEDGLYKLQFTGGVRDNNGDLKTLSFYKQPYLTIYSKNTLNALRFSYSKQEVSINFRLAKTVPSERVAAKSTATGVQLPSSYDQTSNLYTAKITGFLPNQFNNYQILVSHNVIFDFSFKIVNEDDVKAAVKSAIEARVTTEGQGRIAQVYVAANKASLTQEIVNGLKNSMISNSDPISTEQETKFLTELETLVGASLDELARNNRRTLDDRNFWDTTFGKITKTAGNLALRYLGIVVA